MKGKKFILFMRGSEEDIKAYNLIKDSGVAIEVVHTSTMPKTPHLIEVSREFIGLEKIKEAMQI